MLYTVSNFPSACMLYPQSWTFRMDWTLVHGLISQDGVFYSNDVSSTKKSWFQISVKSAKPCGYMKRLHTCIRYCNWLCVRWIFMVIFYFITSHISINIFQTVHFPAVKFTRGNKKIWALCDTKIWGGLKKNLKQSHWAPLRVTLCIRQAT